MPQKVYSDEEVFGAQGVRTYSDEEVFGPALRQSAPSEGASVGDLGAAISGGLGEGALAMQGGLGGFLQAPGASALAAFHGGAALLNRGAVAAANTISGPTPKGGEFFSVDPQVQQTAIDASREAARQRKENIAVEGGSWLNPRTALARVGVGLQEDARSRIDDLRATEAADSPELARQMRAAADASGFVENLQSVYQNPLATVRTLARSLPDMGVGLGVGRTVALSTMKGGVAQAEKAAARVAASGGDVAAQRAAADAVLKASHDKAVERAITAGASAEGTSAAYNSRESVYQELNRLPIKDIATAPRWGAVLKEAGGDAGRAREMLANELADQVPLLVGLGTIAGTRLTNRMFGSDLTAQILAGKLVRTRDVLRNVVQEGTEETVQGVPQDLTEHGGLVQGNTRHELDLGGSAAQNFTAGALLGGLGTSGRHIYQAASGRLASGQQETKQPDPNVAPLDAGNVLDRVEPSDAEKALTAAGSNTSLDRVAEIDAELAKIEARRGEIADPQQHGAQFNDERAALDQQRFSLRHEREALTAAWPKMVMGGEDSVRTDSGVDLGYRWALVPVDEEVRSHGELGSPNPAYPQELQPRDRSRSGSLDQTAKMRQQYDPRRAGASPDVQNGAPIMSADGVILSGNARSNVQEQILRANGQKAADLRNHWIETAGTYGFTPEQMRAAFDANPRLALRRVLTTPVNRAEFARQANASTVAAMSPLEQARSDAARIDDMEDLRPDENGDFAASRDFIRRFVGRVPATEQSGMIDADGALSAAGYARVRNAVLAKAYGDSPVLTRMVESMDDNLRNVSRALLIAAPRVAQSRQAIAQGRRFDADLTPHLVGAVEELGRIKDAGGSVADALAQAGLMGDERTPEARELLAFLAENARRPRRMAEFITAYFDALDAAGDPNQGSLLGEVQAPTTGQLMAAAQGESNAKSTSEDAGRGLAGESGGAGQGAPVGPEAAPGRRGSAQGDAANEQDVAEWQAFAPETGTLGVPRAQMPQVKVARRAELLTFLEGRGIGHARLELPADSLKPTQAEYSPAKTESAAHMVDEQTDRAAVLVSSDGYVLDGHHRWLARSEAHQPVWAIQFDAPIGKLLDAVMQFPGAHVSKDSEGAVTPSARDAAVADFKAAAADLGDFLTKYARAALVPENSPEAHKVLVRLFDAAIRIVGTDLKRGIAWVKNYLRAHKDEIAGWNKITPHAYRKAAEEALAGLEERGQQLGLFNDKELAQPDLFGAPERAPVAEAAAKPAVAMIDGRPYDIERDNFKPEPIESFAPPELVARVRAAVKRFFAAKPERPVSAEDAARATALLAPAIEKATAAKAEFDQQIIDIARRTGALGQMLAGIKRLDRAIPKLVYEETFNIAGIKDLLRSTIVVPTYADAQKVIDAIEERFTVLRVKNLTDAPVESPHIVSVKALPESGYRNVLINVSMPNGTVAEIQINTPAMLSAKAREGHALYEVERDLPEGDATRVAVEAMERELYGAAADADAKRSATQAGGPDVKSPPLGSASRGSSASASPGMSPENLKTRPSGKRTQSSPLDDTTNLQPAGNLSGTLIDSTSQILPEKAGKPYTSDEGGQRDDAPDEHDRSGDARARAQDARGVEGGGQVDGAYPRDGAGHQQRSGERDDGGKVPRGVGQAEPAVQRDGGQHERGAGKRAGNRARRSPAVPAGRDLKPKSGLNYRFTDDDVSPPGSWAKRATWNVEAVELIRKLEAEKRQATPDEQRILARFVGWGASEIANNLFGKKLDAQAKALRDYAEAIENLGDKPFLENNNYRMYAPAFAVLQAKTPELNWYTAGRITKAMLDAARPPASVARWIELRDRLKAALTADEWAEAQRSTQYGHYTSAPIVRGMWQAMERFGFKGGLVFEPGAGKGNFPGLMPDALAANSAYTGIEYDSITGAILKQLLPDELVRVESFIDTKLPRDFFDVAIGNPPFAGLSVLADPEYKKHAFKLHDYFFAKAVDRVRPGGLLMFVTSRFTMDKQGDKARKYLADRADLVGAIRLPQTAFKENAGTEVVTDVLFLRKKVPGADFAQGQAWLKSVPVDVGGTPEMLNEYFAAHPEMVLGTHSRAGSMYKADEYTVLPAEGDIAEAFRAAVERMPADIFDAPAGSAAQAAQVREIDFNPAAKKEGNYYVSAKGVLMQRENGVGQAVIPPKGSEAVIRSFIPLRDALKQAQHDQLNGGDWEASLATLRAEYEKFVAAHGRINQFTMRARNVRVDVLDESGQPTGETTTAVEERPVFTLHAFLRDDPEWTLVSALENVNEDTGEISDADALSKRVLIAAAPRRIETAHDALLASLADTGRVDIPEIADSLGLSDAEAIEALGSAIYRNPEGGAWEMADAYLSGNVRRKLEHAEAAAKNDRTYERNIAALKAALPAPKGPASIDIALGMNWIAGDVYSRFLKETAGLNANVAWNDATRQWSVEMLDKGVGGANAGARFDRAKVEWGTADRHAGDLLEHAMTGRPIVIERKIDVPGGGKSTVRDLAAMEAANVKLAALKKRFSEWVWEDAARADSLLRTYNERFNAVAPRAFDGRHLTLPGTSSLFNVFDHVKRGAWRIIQSGNTYLAHAVGSGKTFEMVISAMEQKRLGLVKKPMMVVPNHMLRQFSSEWLQLYPAARLMVADEHSFHKDKRRQFVSRVALSDLDGVIITHDAFKMLDIDPDFRAKIIDEQLDALRAALENADEEGDKGGRKSPRVKQIEKRIETLEQKLAAAQKADKKDQNARFDELGVDMLYVDEAHLFRKLDFGTARQVKGISSEGSDRALDLYIKARYLDEKRPGRSLVLASGTPITNTLAELYSVMRFLGRTELAEDGMEDFDSWAAQYGRDVTALEANAAGKYEPVTRFAKFVNVPALIQRFKQFADVLTSDNLAALLGDKRPKVMGGARQIIVTPKTTRFRLNQRDLAARFEASRKWKPSKDEPNNPDPIIRIIGDGRLASIDMRFVNPSAPNDPSSKLNRMIDDVIATYKETAGYTYTDKKTGAEEPHKGATMMVFSDLGFGAGVAANRGFDARAWMEKRLREAGIPSKHLAFMSDHKTNDAKKKLFDGMNSGRIRILVGSSKNMGTGVNAQQRLLDLFHLDTPWFPADLEQREGRIVRQGNKNKEVRIRAYATKGSYDEAMWSMLARKAHFIAQAMEGDPNIDEIEDLDSQSQYDLAAAMTADDPRVLQLAGINAEIGKLERLYKAHEDQRMRFLDRWRNADAEITNSARLLAAVEGVAGKAKDLSGDKFAAEANDRRYSERKEWGAAIKDAARHNASGVERTRKIGDVSGFDVTFRSRRTESAYEWWVTLDTPSPAVLIENGTEEPVQIAMRAQNAVASVARMPQTLRENIRNKTDERDVAEVKAQAAFPMAEMLAGKRREAADLLKEIAAAAVDRPWVVTRLDTGESWTVQAHNEDAAIDAGMAQQGGEPEFWRAIEAAEAGAEAGPLLSRTVFHGSPHRGIEKFDTDKIGTGEGAQAYGWGLYFASRKEIAEHYRSALAPRGPATLESELGVRMDEADALWAAARVAAGDLDSNVSPRTLAIARSPSLRKMEPAALDDLLRRAIEVFKAPRGQLYEVHVPDNDELLDWDRPLSEQPAKVREALAAGSDRVFKRAASAQADDFWQSGADFYRSLVSVVAQDAPPHVRLQDAEDAAQRNASEALAALGIKGIRYLDGSSRAHGAGSHNYVIFSGDDVAIERALYSRGVAGGITLPALQAVAERVTGKLPGLRGKVHVLASPADAPPKLRAFIEQRGAMGDVEGAFHDGEIYLFASGIEDETRAEHVLAEHEVAHAGLAAILGDGRKQAMQAIWNNNAEIRRVTKPMIERGLSLAEAVEEAIVDLPSGRLARLKGWRVLVGKMRDALGRLGFDRLAAQIDGWLGGHLSEQQRADLAVADLVRAARGYYARQRETRLADDAAAQEKWLNREARGRGFKDIDDLAERAYPVFEKLAALWRKKHPASALMSRGPGRSVRPEDAEQRGKNTRKEIRLAHEAHARIVANNGVTSPDDLRDMLRVPGYSQWAQSALVGNVDAARALRRDLDAAFEDRAARHDWTRPIVNAQGVITFHDLGRDPQTALDALTAIADRYGAPIAARGRQMEAAGALVAAGFVGYNGISERAGRPSDALIQWIRPAGGIGENTPLFSRAAIPAPPGPPSAAAPQQATVEQRAEKIIQTSASTPKPLDALTRMLTRATGLERLGVFGYGLGAKVLDWITPETVKAGIVSDYGVPQAVIDQRAMLQGRQREQLREAGNLLGKLATMTRAESRVAYEWMNGEDTRTADELMKELPKESVAVLREVRLLVDKLSQEAVRLGQLDAEAFKRHRFAYLRRSYFKHEADLTSGEKKARASAIAILGDQYKGRGIVLSAKMSQIQNIAPDWWGRKVVAGKADASLRGEKFERLERRAPSGEGTAGLDGIDGEKRPGKLLEIHYWPAGEPKPAKYADWDSAGVFEAINTKGGEVTLWRDFTKAERQKMGEIDEARYAIAKTMQRMIHDVEVGKYLEWLAQNHGRHEGEPFAGTIVEASERYRDTFKPGEWVRVPDTKISGTSVAKFGKLAGMYLPGPIWNDVRQVAGGAYRPWGDTYHHILRAWKASKTALSPAVHMNNVMSNFVMADWHDVSSGHVAKALRIVLAAGDRQGRGVLGRIGNAAARLGASDRDAAREIIARYENSGGAIGGWVTQEIANEQMAPIVEALQSELGAKAGPSDIGVYAALQHMLHARLPQAWQAFKGSRPANIVATDAKNLIDLYQAEDDVFRLAAWLKAKEGGASDADAGKAARKSFLDYSINAPWVQMMRQTALPFIGFTYRAVPMLIETAAKRPHKVLKLMMVLGALNMLGSMMAGGDDDDEARKLLPDEKAGRIWGIVPKLIRMPWNDAHDSPVFLDIRRWIPVGDVFDLGQGHAALPVPPALMPGGPLAVLGEVVFNRSMFTGQPIALDTDTATEHASKLANHLWKAAMPNIIGLPGSYATTGVLDAAHGRTDAFGRERSVAQSLMSGIGIKLGSYPPDLLRRNLAGKAKAEIGEIEDEIYRLKRQRATNAIEQDEFEDKVRAQQEKIRGIADGLRERVD